MKVITSSREMQKYSDEMRGEGKTIAFVPTMGGLHEGHLSLMRIGRKRCDILVTSIFVNPTQFSPGEDFKTYPRDFSRDAGLCEAEGVDVIYHPSVEEMYGSDFQTYINVEEISKPLCGSSRPHFFRGVTTVCAKLFNTVKPHIAVFGEKDYQQLLVVRRMVKDLNMDVEIVGAPLIRDIDGIALSSRNNYLNAEQRKAGLSLSRALSEAGAMFSGGVRDAAEIILRTRKIIEKEPMARIDYIEIRDAETLESVSENIDRPVVLALAVFFGKTRLIDNLILDHKTARAGSTKARTGLDKAYLYQASVHGCA